MGIDVEGAAEGISEIIEYYIRCNCPKNATMINLKMEELINELEENNREKNN